jgi:hypothetical protein
MKTPEQIMKEGILSLIKANNCFEEAVTLYEQRNTEKTADKLNAENVKEAISKLSEAYDCISEIWENDIINNLFKTKK